MIITWIHEVVGVPLFLMWVSQTGTFLAQTFQFFYANICCALCIKGRRRRAAKEAARAQRRARAQHLQGTKLLNTGEYGEGAKWPMGGSSVLEVKQLKVGGVDCKRLIVSYNMHCYFSWEALYLPCLLSIFPSAKKEAAVGTRVSKKVECYTCVTQYFLSIWPLSPHMFC